MPSAAPRICTCGKIVAAGVRCQCQINRHAEAKARSDKRRPNAHARGYNHEWSKARKEFLALNSRCAHPGCNAYATHLDHIAPHRGDHRLFWIAKIGSHFVNITTTPTSNARRRGNERLPHIRPFNGKRMSVAEIAKLPASACTPCAVVSATASH